MTPRELALLLDDAAFVDGRAAALLGAALARREAVARAQEHAHRLLEHMLWGSDPSGRIVLPDSPAEERASTGCGHFRALTAIAGATARDGLLARTARAADGARGWAGLAVVLAAFQDDLEEAAAAFAACGRRAAWPVRPLADDAAYTSGARAAVLALRDAAGAHDDLFEQVFVHGSYATLDERPGVSDLDVGVVLRREAGRDPRALLAARRVTGGWWRHLQDVDPLQHHGVFAYTAADLAFYPQTFLPFAVLTEARALTGDLSGRVVHARPTGLARRLTLLRAAAFLRQPAPDSLFALKMFLQSVLLAPVFLAQAGGTFVYKRDAFAPFEARADAAPRRAVALASRARAEDWYADDLAGLEGLRARLRADGLEPVHEAAVLQRALDRAVAGRLRGVLGAAAAADRAALATLLEEALTAAGGSDDPDDAPDDEPALPPRARTAAPAPDADPWLAAARAYEAALGAPGLVAAAWCLGSRGVPPGSDLDLVVVVDPDRAARFDWSNLYERWAGLDDAHRRVMIHPPSAILSPARARDLGLLFPVFRCEALWGAPPRPEWWRCTDPDQALALLSDYLLAQYPGEFLDFLDADAPAPVTALGRAGGLRHALALARQAGLRVDPAWDEVPRRALEARRSGDFGGERVRELLERSLGVAEALVDAVAVHLRGLGIRGRTDAPLAGLIGDRVLLLGASSPALARDAIRQQRARLGAGPVNAVPVELAFGLLAGIAADPAVREIYGEVVDLVAPVSMPPPPEAWRARWRAVAAHARELRAWGCAGGYLFPNHLHLDPQRFYAGAGAPA